MGKDELSNEEFCSLGICMRKMEIGSLFTPHTQIYFIWNENVNIKGKNAVSRKIVNTEKHFHDIGIYKYFLKHKALIIKNNTDYFTYINRKMTIQNGQIL